jgi:hypothetical protein
VRAVGGEAALKLVENAVGFVAGGFGVFLGRGVAVAGWQWWRWKEEIEAVRMVVVGIW